MISYYDSNLILKLYTEEPESEKVRTFVRGKARPILFSELHYSECISALRLKCFRQECAESEASSAILDIEEDISSGVLQRVAIEWAEVWELCRTLSNAHAAETGCRTLDVLHIACARQLGAREFYSSDTRQMKLAKKIGLRVTSVI